MQLPELLRTLRHLGLSGMAQSLEARLLQAQADHLPPADFLALLVQDELTRRADRLLTRRLKEAHLRDADKTLDGFDFDFNKKMDRHPLAPPLALNGYPLRSPTPYISWSRA